ncbi:MAG: hypothetical protein ACFFER_07230, partial [Candidatus Thorarchaeota archaeon]
MSIKQNEPYFEKLAKLTPVYIIGILTIAEPWMGIIRDRTFEERVVAVAVLVAISLIMFYVVEIGNRQLNTNRRAQLGVTLVSALLYIFLQSMRMLEVDLVAAYFGPVFLMVAGIWTFLAPILVDYAPHWQIKFR